MSNKVIPAFAQRLANQFDDTVVANIQGYIAKTKQLQYIDETTVVNFLQDMVYSYLVKYYCYLVCKAAVKIPDNRMYIKCLCTPCSFCSIG